MRIEIKLYSYHDLDLVSLYKTGRVAFPETTRQVLNSYARKEVYKVRLLPLNEDRAAKYPQKMYRKFYHYHVDLDETEDADAIRLIKMITEGYRNNFIKSVLRQYLCGVFIEEYSKDGSAKFFNEMSRRIQGDRDERDIKQVKRKNKKEKKKGAGKPKNKSLKVKEEREIPVQNLSVGETEEPKPAGPKKIINEVIENTKPDSDLSNLTNQAEQLSVNDNDSQPIMPLVDKNLDSHDILSNKEEQKQQLKFNTQEPDINNRNNNYADDSEDSELDDFLDGLTEQY